MASSPLPGVLFAMRYPNDVGYVWNTMARIRDLVAGRLEGEAKCFIAYPELKKNAAYQPAHMQPVALDCYDRSAVSLAALEQFIRANSIKVVVYMSALAQTLDMSLFRRLGVKTLNTENDSFDVTKRDPAHKQLVKFLLRRVLKRQIHDLHLANAASQQAFLQRFGQIPAERLVLVQDGVDCERFCPGDRAAACTATGLDPARTWVLSVSQAREEKRVDLLLRVAKRVIEARPQLDIGFVHVGDGYCLEDWKTLAQTYGIADRFIFAGHQSDTLNHFRAASLFAHAAERESFGLAVVEAMACGLPVIASAAAGPSETVRDGETGALIAIHDESAFGDAALRYLDDADLRAAHGRAARERATTRFSMASQADQFARHVRSFLPR